MSLRYLHFNFMNKNYQVLLEPNIFFVLNFLSCQVLSHFISYGNHYQILCLTMNRSIICYKTFLKSRCISRMFENKYIEMKFINQRCEINDNTSEYWLFILGKYVIIH